MKWDTNRLIEAPKHAAEVATNCDDEKCSQEHAELAGWLEELRRLRELAPLVGAVTMLLTHDDPRNDLGKLARCSVRSVLARWSATCAGLLDPDGEVDWRKAVEDCFGAIPEGEDAEGWFKNQVGELRGRLEWTEKALEARKGFVGEDTVGKQQKVERLIEEHYRLGRLRTASLLLSDLAEDIVTALEAYDV